MVRGGVSAGSGTHAILQGIAEQLEELARDLESGVRERVADVRRRLERMTDAEPESVDPADWSKTVDELFELNRQVYALLERARQKP